jgi:predicted RNA-binding Zn-ribbon protein involved in translation (DUF1610 family)
MKKIQLNKIIKVCPDCGFEIISFVSDDEPIVMSDDINGVFVLCPKCGDYVPIIEIPEIDENDESDIIFTLEDCKYDLEEYEKRIIESKLEIKRLTEELPYLEADANKFKFIMNKLHEKLDKINDSK